MCTNFTPTKDKDWVAESFGVDLPQDYPAEAYPGFAAPLVVRSRRTGRIACGLARFGLIPAWAKDSTISRHTYNARSETAAQKPSYRTAWAKGQYGLVLVDHFFEPNYESGKPVRWKIAVQSNAPFAIACLWDRWSDPATGESVPSFSMLTVNADAHPVMNRFHKQDDEKRTPMILPDHLYRTWLEADVKTATRLMDLALVPALQAMPAPKGA